MTAEQLWESRTFHTLLNDLFKSRKNDELAIMRLQAILDFVGKQAAAQGEPHSATILRQQMRPLDAEETKEVLAVTSDNLPDPISRLEEVAQIILKCIERDGKDKVEANGVLIDASRAFDHNYLKDYLNKEHQLGVQSLAIGIAPGALGNMAGDPNAKGKAKNFVHLRFQF